VQRLLDGDDRHVEDERRVRRAGDKIKQSQTAGEQTVMARRVTWRLQQVCTDMPQVGTAEMQSAAEHGRSDELATRVPDHPE
jgi:hypothetical protein